MYRLGPHGTALKVRFIAAGGSLIGAIYADGMECTGEGIGFYFGTRHVAFLTRKQLCIEGRTIDRGLLDQSRPFWFEWAKDPDFGPSRRQVQKDA